MDRGIGSFGDILGTPYVRVDTGIWCTYTDPLLDSVVESDQWDGIPW